MTEERLVLAELLEKASDGDFLRAVAEAVLQLLMESDVEGMIGAGRYERSGERTTWRNGYRERTFDTRLGALQLRIPKLRQGSYFPPFLEARKSSEKALIAVIQEAWIGGVSTRRVDDLVQAYTTDPESVKGLPNGQAWLASVERADENVRHLSIHRGHSLDISNGHDALVDVSAAKQMTFTGTREELRERLAQLEARGATGIIFGTSGYDVERELRAYAEVAGLR